MESSPTEFANKAALQAALNTQCINEAYITATYGDISTWNVSLVTDMSYLIHGISCRQTFNGDIDGWNVKSVTNMNGMFQGASAFNQAIGA